MVLNTKTCRSGAITPDRFLIKLTMTNVVQNISKIKNPNGNFGPSLDMLAQPHTKSTGKSANSLQNLKRRARAKFIGRALVLELVKIDSPLKKSYWNTWHCSNEILQDGKTLTSKYCNNRWCPVCNRIRTGKLIKGYMSELAKMQDPQFVTLTIPNVPGEDLKDTIEDMISTFIKIKNLFYGRRAYKLNGIRKVEVTHNDETGEYHPHFHLVLDGREVGEALIAEWLKRYSDANRRAQDIRRADENSMIELFKYTTKLTTKNKVTRDGNKIVMQINPEALDVIFQALYRKRTFQAMGWVKMVSEDIDELDAQEIEDMEEGCDVWSWEQEVSDWVNSAGELLTGCDAYCTYVLKADTG